jgi:hypothetical protein
MKLARSEARNDEFRDLLRVRGAADWSLLAVIGKKGLTIIHLTPPDIRHHAAFPCRRSIRKYSRYKINLHKCDTDHIWLLAGRIWRTTLTKQFYGVEKQNHQ